ncbi:MAG: hypothetical protein NTZ69_10735 [Bacteroidia bacterium]|nr:hypothetical protein [Bacteroidia bacterium]
MNIDPSLILYDEIFDDKEQNINELLENIPSDLIIKFLCYVNALLSGSDVADIKAKQIKIFKKFFDRFQESLKLKIITHLKDNRIFFLRPFLLEFIHRELIRNKDIPDFIDTDPQREINIFKAYLLISQEVQKKYSTIDEEIDRENLFAQSFWPLMAYQYDLDGNFNANFQLLKGALYLSHFKKNSQLSKYYDEFIKRNSCSSGMEYFLKLVSFLFQAYSQNEVKFICKDNTDATYVHFILDRIQYISDSRNFLTYNGLKEHPIYEAINGELYIIDWNFWGRKLYDGLIRDFYQQTSISNEFKTFPDFLSKFSKDIAEDQLFKKVMGLCFCKKYCEYSFDEFPTKNPVDFYLRYNQYIFLFEFKNNYFSSGPLSTGKYDSIIEEINKKMNFSKNGKKRAKGIPQIVRQMKEVSDIFKTKDGKITRKIKIRNVVIFPIIVYSDKFFGMPGVNDYLNGEFRKQIQGMNELNFGKIENLILISIDFFFYNLKLLAGCTITDFIGQIKTFNYQIEKSKKIHSKSHDQKDYLRIFRTFEEINEDKKAHNQLTLKELFKHFDISLL